MIKATRSKQAGKVWRQGSLNLAPLHSFPPMAELVDAPGLEPGAFGREGSTPSWGTIPLVGS